jgi:heme-degrading monooxygenase HmoA
LLHVVKKSDTLLGHAQTQTEAVEAPRLFLFRLSHGSRRSKKSSTGRLFTVNVKLGASMHATIRRYEGIDQARTDELTRKVGETLLPRLSEMPGFKSYYLIQADKDVMRSITFFDTRAQADESTRVAAEWVREEKLETALPHSPKVMSGEVIVEKTRELVQV